MNYWNQVFGCNRCAAWSGVQQRSPAWLSSSNDFFGEQVRQCAELILVEGLFDYAAVWQAGFRNVTCSLGTHLNARQFRQLSGAARTVYVAFDSDVNRSGQQAAHHWAHRLGCEGVTVRIVELPDGHDPNSFFAAGGEASQFRSLLEAARPGTSASSISLPQIPRAAHSAWWSNQADAKWTG